ncbi:hypothetical protein D3C79_1047250 [compost metagenome]
MQLPVEVVDEVGEVGFQAVIHQVDVPERAILTLVGVGEVLVPDQFGGTGALQLHDDGVTALQLTILLVDGTQQLLDTALQL